MDNVKKIIKKIINNPDILYPSDQFPGIVLSNDDFISFAEFLELSRQETVKKYTTLRDIANSIIKKDGLVQGIAYSENARPLLTLLFRAKKPLGYQKRYQQASKKTEEEEKLESDIQKAEETNDKKFTTEVSSKLHEDRDKLKSITDEKQNNIQALEDELKDYQEKYKEYLDLIADYNSPIVVRTNKGELVLPDDEKQNYDESFSGYDITSDILDYLLNASNLTSDIEMEFVRQYYEELNRYKEALESDILYHDFSVVDYTGNFYITTNHSRFCIFKQENAINIPKKFGKVSIQLYNPSMLSNTSFSLKYHASSNSYSVDSSLYSSEDEKLLQRGFIHKGLLPDAYRKR